MKDDQASLTALTVLQGILATAENERYRHLLSDAEIQLYEHILQSSPAGRKKLKQVHSPFLRALLHTAEKMLMPGIGLHYVLRKRYIEQQSRQAIDEGFEQIISLGAGFDSLCWRLSSEYPLLNFIEIDHPASSALKQQALNKLGEVSASLHFLNVDFAQQTLLDALRQCPSFHEKKRTLYICEGVMMYLQPDAITLLMQSIATLAGENGRFIFTAVAPMDSPNNNTGWLHKFALKFMDEPLCWSFESTEIEDWLLDQHYRLLQLATSELFRDRFISPDDDVVLHQGEYIAVVQPAFEGSTG